MGDHRASIKIEMEFHGVKDKCDMWINYYPGECDGVDDRIIEFCRNIYNKGMMRYDKERDEWLEDKHKEQIEESEKLELKRLKEKYEQGEEGK